MHPIHHREKAGNGAEAKAAEAHDRLFDEKGLMILHRDYAGGKIGLWLFLFTELLLFGGMFLIYAIYRARYSEVFHVAAQELNTGIGALNTLLLLTSSLTVAVSITALQKGNKKVALLCLYATIAMGLGFMVNKDVEWSAKFHHHLYPGSEEMLKSATPGWSHFYSLYFIMTGLHGLHVVAGLALLGVMVVWVAKDKVNRKEFGFLENSGLYWHLVDLIWIYLFPLFYLIS